MFDNRPNDFKERAVCYALDYLEPEETAGTRPATSNNEIQMPERSK